MDKKTITISIVVIAIAVAVGTILAGLWASKAPVSVGGAQSGSFGTRATSSAQTVITTARTVFATSTNDFTATPNSPDSCHSRIVTVNSVSGNANAGIMLTFDDKDTPTATFGHWQASSSTVAYDGGLYGCGRVKAIGTNTVGITTTEF